MTDDAKKCNDLPTDTSDSPLDTKEQHLAEYQQVCEMYRLGLNSMLSITRLYMTWHAGLAVALGFVLSHRNANFSVSICGVQVRIILLIISLLGFLAGFGAFFMSRRYEEFHRAMVPRATYLEEMYGMRFLRDIEEARSRARYLGASTIALILFILLAGLWGIFIWRSFTS